MTDLVRSLPAAALRQRRLRHGLALPIAHRGLFEPGRLPENSMGAFALAIEKGLAMECDVRLDAVGDVAVFHDDMLERLTEGVGRFANTPVADVAHLRLQGTSYGIPWLRELLANIAGRVPLVVELKSFGAEGWHTDGRLERAVVEALQGYEGVVLLKSFNPHSVTTLLDLDHNWPVGQIACAMVGDGDFGFLSNEEALRLTHLDTDAARGAHFISYGIADLSYELRFASAHADKPWMTWTVRTPDQMNKALRLGCQVIFERGVLGEVLDLLKTLAPQEPSL